ncbi:type 11 methyltransferase, partial [Erwinia tracheiphila PSU-1]
MHTQNDIINTSESAGDSSEALCNDLNAQSYTATYSPDDNKLRLYALHRLDDETWQRLKEAGFKSAPKQKLFVAPMWTPAREDLLI